MNLTRSLVVLGRVFNHKMLLCQIKKPCSVASIVGIICHPKKMKQKQRKNFPSKISRAEIKSVSILTDFISALLILDGKFFLCFCFIFLGWQMMPTMLATLQGFFIWHRSILWLNTLPNTTNDLVRFKP